MRLSVNVDHVATIRQARMADEPDPVWASVLAELAGACGITVHLRGDRRHIQDRDVELLGETVVGVLNLEMRPSEEMVSIARRLKPDMCTLVPEGEGELTTRGGLDVVGEEGAVRGAVSALRSEGIEVSIFIDPDVVQVGRAKAVGADIVELHTGVYADASTEDEARKELEKIKVAAVAANGDGALRARRPRPDLPERSADRVDRRDRGAEHRPQHRLSRGVGRNGPRGPGDAGAHGRGRLGAEHRVSVRADHLTRVGATLSLRPSPSYDGPRAGARGPMLPHFSCGLPLFSVERLYRPPARSLNGRIVLR